MMAALFNPQTISMKKWILFLNAVSLFSLAQSQPEPSWLISGNSGTNPAFNFLGTTDNQPLRFRVANVYAGEIDSVGGKAFFGYRAGGNITTGIYNVAVGYKSMYSNTTASNNTAIGYQSLYSTITGYNTATGSYALYSNTYGVHNTASGSYALYANTTGITNTAFGKEALRNNTTANYNTASGAYALYSNTTGQGNTAHGLDALSRSTTGQANTAVGYEALSFNTTTSFNTGIGAYALIATTSSQNNTSVGYRAGDYYNLGWNNTLVGANSNVNASGLYNCVALGESVTCTASSQARIGNSSTVSIGGYVGWSNISDGRYKKDIKENVKGLDFIMKLQPVTYHLDVSGLSKKLNEGRGKEIDEFTQKAIAEKEKIVFSGFVAQDVEKVANETGYDFSGVDKPKNENDFYGLRYAEFVVPLVKAVQELSGQNTELKNQLDELKKTSSDQKKLNDDLLERIKRLESSFVTKK
jgi:hypothetical protein